ncbi:5-amino-6-(D-ribitylamino)uracil--L-tyrosine 4-hydroxyphenyl transferase CofH [Methylobacterium sp. NEAU 140]|uniref:5-amino-6-(D-ribitylamino)uracil--L-tyrosine 4-hydroxyphenyl transferase CofH n=1 Tax=Methylobacterium sp. NEAU 140 TaxID=3064945 RepID=UPI0027332105|nr:5-amino-6-(D-ribitylamino)uracil--L-tyrosine 4-hydroxyphenyl transferase CofH [Methylobacterium sp. NEAU 140]MDP4026598.1 5-amino-6-(D-ribitylamino)uracil--L-tyrosine 4-hydroxyphenyl transferase CofH [Methylobacterium sp. NEAU 140]
MSDDLLDALARGEGRLDLDAALMLSRTAPLTRLMAAASERRDLAHGAVVSFSRKVFIPLTRLCRDVCHYCTFAASPRHVEAPFLSPEDVLAIARAGREAGCREALFTLGDKPELRYGAARRQLSELGHETTISYLIAMCDLVYRETGLLPHANPGLLSAADLAGLRAVTVSQGIMLESTARRLGAAGGPHHGSPDKDPAARLETIRLAGEQSIPFTSGILVGIGEDRRERIEALLALREIHEAHGHLQEVIIQSFRPKPGTRMAEAPPMSDAEHMRTIALARLIFDPSMNLQAPPNLSPGMLPGLVAAGVNDWGGVSPVTPDHVNPEAPWPHLDALRAATAVAGKFLAERLAIYPAYAREPGRWLGPAFGRGLLPLVDADGWPRTDGWWPGDQVPAPAADVRWIDGGAAALAATTPVARALAELGRGRVPDEAGIAALFRARGPEFAAVCAAADDVRRSANGDTVSYVITRNINYTNVCYFKCQFCAFSKGKLSENLRGRPYDLPLAEIRQRVSEAWDRGATEVCMQGGIHPAYTGQTYIDILRAVKDERPGIHVHAFSPLEIHQGAESLGMPIESFLGALKDGGLGSLPGTAAEVLDDEVRAVLCPDKIGTDRWLAVMRAAHRAGLRSTATIMFGHVDRYEHWARHLMRIRELQCETGGFTEFVPLPFVHMEAPIYLKGSSRRGPTFRETILMHAVARLVLAPVINNIQASWVKLGPESVGLALMAGVNDLGGTLMDETISRSAGASHGSQMTPADLERIIVSAGRTPRRRTTLYGEPSRPGGPTAPIPSYDGDHAFRTMTDVRQWMAS